MKTNLKSLLLGVFFALSFVTFSQDPTDWTKIKLDPIKEKQFQPYLEYRHSVGTDYQNGNQKTNFNTLKRCGIFRNHSILSVITLVMELR